MSVEAAPKIVLQNKLSRSRVSLQELEPLISSTRSWFFVEDANYNLSILTESDFDRLYKKLQDCKFDHSIGEIDNVVDVSPSSCLISSLPFKQLMTSTVGLSGCATPAGNLS